MTLLDMRENVSSRLKEASVLFIQAYELLGSSISSPCLFTPPDIALTGDVQQSVESGYVVSGKVWGSYFCNSVSCSRALCVLNVPVSSLPRVSVVSRLLYVGICHSAYSTRSTGTLL